MTKTDPRAIRSREAALESALALLRRGGLVELTHLNLARESGLGRSTIYRHWPEVADLILDLLGAFRMPDFEHVDAPLRERIRYNLHIQKAQLFDADYRAVYQAMGEFAMEPRVRARLQEINGARIQSVVSVLLPDYDLRERRDQVTEVLALLNGPIYQMATFVGTVSHPLIESTLDSVVSYLSRCQPEVSP